MDGGAWTRRWFVHSLAGAVFGASTGRGRTFPASRHSYVDPATESRIERLTAPSFASYLPDSNVRCVSRRRFLVFSSDRTGSPQAFQLDVRSGQSRQLTEARDFESASLALLPDDDGIVYFDGASIRHTELKKLRDREIYRVPEGFRRAPGLGIAPDGRAVALVETRGAESHLKLVSLAGDAAQTVFTTSGSLHRPLPRPGREQILYRGEGGTLWLVDYAGRENRKLEVAAAGQACWAPDGSTVLYLSVPRERGERVAICEYNPETGAAGVVAPTSQYAQFGVNGDASVFVGASGSRASPYLVLLLRLTRRELSLCEHQASNPSTVSPAFSPDSQYLYFVSDRDGKPAIYSMNLERLVEPT